ncbi:MAG: hypothetical protein ACE37K_21715 [Planctomycetota bacterium]
MTRDPSNVDRNLIDDDEYWQRLQQASDEAQAPSADELTDAEQLLAELDEQGEAEPLADTMVDAIVADVTAVADATGIGHGAPQAKVHDLSSWRGLLAAAAALLVAPKFLLAAGAITAIAVSALVLRHTTTSLPFQEAIAILTDAQQDLDARSAAQGRVYFDVIESIGILRDVAAEPAMAAGAERGLAMIRAAVDDDQPFAISSFAMQHQLLGSQALASDGDLSARLSSVDQLTEQIVYGVRALKAIAAAGEPQELMAQNQAQLQRIRAFAQR